MESEHIKKIISQLNKLRIGYAFTGAFAVSYYGFPRASTDIDILIEKDSVKLLKLADLLHIAGFDVTKSDVNKAVEECSHFAVFNRGTTFPYFDIKVACEKDELESVKNCQTIVYHGVKCRIVSVEDLLIKKLEWNDIRDVQVILRRRKEIDLIKLVEMSKERKLYTKLQKVLKASA